MLCPPQGQLGKVQAQLASKAEAGQSLSRVDFEQQRIEHAQAEAALAAAAAEAVALKAQLAAAQGRLADQRAALAGAAAAVQQLRAQAGARQGQLAGLEADAAQARKACAALERECERLQAGKQQGDAPAGAAGGATRSAAPTIEGYMRLKHACAETSKRVADWQRKLEVQAGRRGGRR